MLNQDYKDILQSFISQDVEFLIVGAYALSKHGLVRATGDIDLLVNPTQENSKKIFQALIDFGSPTNDLDQETFTNKGVVFQIGVIPRRIDILTEIDGVSFKQCWENREKVVFDGLEVFIISLEDLLINKSSTDRIKDKADVEWIEKNIKKNKS